MSTPASSSPATSILWTSLPAGVVTAVTPAAAALSVFASPRLTGPGGATLADFPLFAGWAAAIAGASFQLAVDGGPTVPATVVSSAPDPQLWAQLFPPSTPVIARGFDEAKVGDRVPSSYSQAAVHGYFKSGYVDAHTASPVAVPPHQQLALTLPAFAATTAPRALVQPAAGHPDEVTALRQAAAQVADDLVAHAAAGTLSDAVAHAHAIAIRLAALSPPGTPVPLIPATGTPASEVGRLMAFHHVPPAQAGVSPGPATDPVAADFHAIVTALLAYPLLLRRLGLVIDLQVPLTMLPSADLGAATPGRLRVVPPPLAAATAVTPWTAYMRDGDRFFTAAPAPSDTPQTVAGLVNLALADYELFQLDVDGAALKAANAAGASSDAGTASPLPSLRTTGLTLSRAGQADALTTRMAANQANHDAITADPAAPVTLYAEDVQHGLRLDVFDEHTGAWTSLHRRVGSYTVAGQPVLTAEDEGAAQPSASHLPDVGPPSPLRVPEALARWEGWSMSAPRPGAAMTDSGPARSSSTPAAGGVPLTVAFTAAPGSLPRLRFGRSYRLRARAVDVAGNSLSSAEADALLQALAQIGHPAPVLPPSGGTAFQRFEPVGGPVLVPRERSTEGESAERLVIRSDRAEDAASCGRRLSGLPGGTGLRYLAVSERHLAPPKVTLNEAERSGCLDGLSPEAAYALAHRDSGQLSDSAVADAATGRPAALPPVPDTDPVTGAAVGTRPAVEVVPSGSSSYAVHHEPSLALPYLPDPLSAGVVLCGLPGQEAGTQGTVGASGALTFGPWSLDDQSKELVGCTTAIPFGGTWPLTGPLRLSLVEGDGPPAWDAVERVLTVALPKGRTASVRVSSFLPDGGLDVLGIWAWVLADQAARGQAATLAEPELAQRGLAWLLTPYRELTLVHAVQRPLTDPDLSNLALGSRSVNDTGVPLSADVTLDAPSTARVDLTATWTETVDDVTDANSGGPVTVTGQAAVFSQAVAADGSGQAAGPVLPVSGRHEFGDTRHRRVTYRATAASAFREYFPPGVATADMTVTGTSVTVDVPSSGRPPAPVIRAAVPVFSWQRPDGLAGPRVRTQTGIRLVLERPWLVSGDGEQLAVLLAPAGQPYPPTDGQRPFVTYWGSDPIAGQAAGAPAPAASAFGGPAAPLILELPEAWAQQVGEDHLGGQRPGQVQVVPLPVTYDPGQQAWLCDVPVTPPAGWFQPFVRLAVARYQPDSVSGAALSPVTLAPPVQLLPQRTVTVTPGSTPDTVSVQVAGTGYYGGNASWRPDDPTTMNGVFMPAGQHFVPVPDLVQVSVQQRIPGTVDDAGWRPYAGTRAGTAVSSGTASPTGTSTVLWQGSVTLPAGRAPGQFRILVAEYQQLLSDAVVFYTWDQKSDGGLPTSPGNLPTLAPPRPPAPVVTKHRDPYSPGSPRLVFAETIPI